MFAWPSANFICRLFVAKAYSSCKLTDHCVEVYIKQTCHPSIVSPWSHAHEYTLFSFNHTSLLTFLAPPCLLFNLLSHPHITLQQLIYSYSYGDGHRIRQAWSRKPRNLNQSRQAAGARWCPSLSPSGMLPSMLPAACVSDSCISWSSPATNLPAKALFLRA